MIPIIFTYGFLAKIGFWAVLILTISITLSILIVKAVS